MIKEHLHETIIIFALFKCRKFDKKRNWKKGLIFMNNVKERIKIFSGAQLNIAFLSMLIDHTNKALIYPNLDGGALNAENNFFSAFPTTIFFPLTPSHLFSDRFPLSLRHFPHLQLIFFHLCSRQHMNGRRHWVRWSRADKNVP